MVENNFCSISSGCNLNPPELITLSKRPFQINSVSEITSTTSLVIIVSKDTFGASITKHFLKS